MEIILYAFDKIHGHRRLHYANFQALELCHFSLVSVIKNERIYVDTHSCQKYIYKHIRKNLLPLNNIRFSEYSLPQVTLREGYGNSIDRAILLAAMLKAVDIKYEFIPVSSWVYVDQRMEFLQKVPVNVFTELLVYLPEFDVFLNDSGLYASAGFLRHGNNICLKESGLSHVNTYSGTHSDITIIGGLQMIKTYLKSFRVFGDYVEIETYYPNILNSNKITKVNINNFNLSKYCKVNNISQYYYTLGE